MKHDFLVVYLVIGLTITDNSSGFSISSCVRKSIEGKSTTVYYRNPYKVCLLPIEELNKKYDVKHVFRREGSEEHLIDSEDPCIEVPPFTYPPGSYELYVKTILREDRSKSSSILCNVEIQQSPPVALINGGSQRVVSSNTKIVLFGNNSLDLERRAEEKDVLTYEWRCKQKLASGFCKPDVMSSLYNFTIPVRYVVDGEIFTVSLTVTSRFGATHTTEQIIEVTDEAAELHIGCTKNCPPVSDTSNLNKTTLLYGTCHKNCKGIQDYHYQWSLRDLQDLTRTFNYSDTKFFAFGQKMRKFSIVKDSLRSGKYAVDLQLTAASPYKGGANIVLVYDAILDVKNCAVNPPTGKSLETFFTFSCETIGGDFYELYDSQFGGQLILTGNSPDVFKVPFLLPPGDLSLFVQVSSFKTNSQGEATMKVKVTSAFEQKTSDKIMVALQKVYDGNKDDESIGNLINSNDTEKRKEALQKFKGVIDEIASTNSNDTMFNEFIQNLKYSALHDMLDASLVGDEILIVGESLNKLMVQKELPVTDPILAKLSTTICRKMADKQRDMVTKERFPLRLDDRAVEIASVLTKCAESNRKPNLNALKSPSRNDSNAEEHLGVVEEYPDYIIHDEEYFDNFDNLQESAYNIRKTAATAAKIIAMTTAVGEDVIEVQGNEDRIIVLKDLGEALASTSIRSEGVILKPSQDFAGSNHPFDILMTIWKKDLMWWNPGQVQVATPIVNVEIWHSTCKERVNNFQSPSRIIFEMKRRKTPHRQIIEDTLQVPKNFLNIHGRDLNKIIKVRRIAVGALQTLRVRFHNLTDSDVLDVVLTKFRYPTIDDFAHNSTVRNGSNEFLILINNHTYDVWCYYAVLPNRENVLKKNIVKLKYNVSFAVTFCVEWKHAKKEWTPACASSGPENDFNRIQCDCNKFSLIAGYYYPVEAVTQEILPVDFVLHLKWNYTAFISVVVVFAIYCVLITFAVRKKKYEIYYLADNDMRDRFVYVVIVKTAVGTTSNIMIRIYGTKGVSDPHVLNWPDPEMRLLQKGGEDKFVLTTRSHLGDIKKVELWYDCSGSKPSYCCKAILIYDMQKQIDWSFKIEQRLFITAGVTHIVVEPMTAVPESKKFYSRIQTYDYSHIWHLVSNEEHFAYIKRLTVILSTIMTTNALALVFQGLPKFEKSDSIDVYNGYYFSGIYVGFLSSFIAFIIHNIIAYLFRYSKMQFSLFKQEVPLPYCVTLGCWVVLLFLIVSSMTILVVYGFWVPYYSSMIWLTSCIVGLAANNIIFENILIVIKNLIFHQKWVHDIRKKYIYVLPEIERQRAKLHEKFGSALFRPYVQHLYQPLDESLIKEKAGVVKLRLSIIAELEDVLMFGVYIILLYVVILVNKDALTVLSHNEMKDMMDGKFTRTKSFSSIQSVSDMYTYLEKTLIPSMQPITWYNNHNITVPGTMLDVTNKYLGVARLRQQRIKPGTCHVPEILRFLSNSCFPELSNSNMETRMFGQRWKNISGHWGLNHMDNIWQYQDVTKTGSISSFGEFGIYHGDGYVAQFGRTLHNSLANFRMISRKSWIDQRTRTIFIEFLTYNIDYNLFTAVRLLYEQSATGYFYKNFHITVARMLFVQNEMETVTMVMFFLFIGWAIIMFIKLMIGLIFRFRASFKNVWFFIDVFICFTSIGCLVMIYIRMNMLEDYMKRLESVKHNQFINYFSMIRLEEVLRMVEACLVCVATIRLWKFLRFGKIFRVLEGTLAMAAFPLLAVSLSFFLLLIAFGLSGILLMGNEFTDFYSFMDIARTLITMSLKPDQLDIREFLDSNVDYLYFSLYLLLMQVVFFFYVAIVVMAYLKAQLVFSEDTDEYTLATYIQEQFQYLPKWCKMKMQRLKGGEEPKKVVLPKADEFRYANCVQTSTKRMAEMKFLTKCIVRNLRQTEEQKRMLTNYENELMLGVCRQFVFKGTEEDDKELFFKGHFVGERVQLIDERRIGKMEAFVSLMLTRRGYLPSITNLKDSDGKKLEFQNICSMKIRENHRILKRCDLNLRLLAMKLDKINIDISIFMDHED